MCVHCNNIIALGDGRGAGWGVGFGVSFYLPKILGTGGRRWVRFGLLGLGEGGGDACFGLDG